MPLCKRCGRQAATNEFRRSPKGGHICRDKIGCKHDRKIKLQGGSPGPRSLQELLRF